jgi:hypothetical protein
MQAVDLTLLDSIRVARHVFGERQPPLESLTATLLLTPDFAIPAPVIRVNYFSRLNFNCPRSP